MKKVVLPNERSTPPGSENSSGSTAPRPGAKDQTGTRSMVVEFAGAPGAGKSTLCRAVAKQLQESSRIPVRMQKMEKIIDMRSVRRTHGTARVWAAVRMAAHTLKSTLLEPAVALRFFRVFREDKGFTMSDLLLQVQIHSSRLSRIRRLRESPGLHLCDSGAVTSYCQMKMYGANNIPLHTNAGPAGYFVVYLRVPEVELRRRIMQRPHNPRARRVHSRDPGRLRAFLEAINHLEEDRARNGQEGSSYNMMVIDNDHLAPEEAASEIAKSIEREWARWTPNMRRTAGA